MARRTWLPSTASTVRVAVPIAALLFVSAVLVVPGRIGGATTTYARIGPLFTIADLAAGLGLIAVGVYAWFAWPRPLVGALGMLGGVIWFGPDWVGSAALSDAVRSLGLVITPFFLPVMVHLLISATAEESRTSRRRWIIALLYVATAAVTIGRVVTYIPYDEHYCWAICSTTGNVFAYGGGNATLTRLLGMAWLVLATLGWLALAAWSARRLLRPARVTQPGWRATIVASIGVGLAWAAYTIALLTLRNERPDGDHGELFAAVFLARAIMTLLFAGGLAWLVTGRLRRTAAIRDVADAIAATPAPGTLRSALAKALGENALDVVFPLDEGQRYVDASGQSVAAPVAGRGRALTTIERGGRPIAVVVHDASIESQVLEREIGFAARLAVDNERLRAVVLTQLEELKASRARVVYAGDLERRRIERDLHDGAQQRLLALSYEIRIARAAAERSGDRTLGDRLARADAHARSAIDELREIAHGIYPAVLSESGLAPALATLSDDSSLPIELDISLDERLPADVEIAAYRVVAEALARAPQRGASYLAVLVRREGDRIRLEVTDDGETATDTLGRAADRVSAIGGSLASLSSDRGALIRVELPCG